MVKKYKVSPGVYLSLCLYVYLSVCLSVCLPACLPISLIYLSICLSVCLSLSVCLPIYLPTYLYNCLSAYLSIYLSIYLHIYLPIYLSVCMSICLSVCLSTYISLSLVNLRCLRLGDNHRTPLERGTLNLYFPALCSLICILSELNYVCMFYYLKYVPGLNGVPPIVVLVWILMHFSLILLTLSNRWKPYRTQIYIRSLNILCVLGCENIYLSRENVSYFHFGSNDTLEYVCIIREAAFIFSR
jgi:hypothetical protein